MKKVYVLTYTNENPENLNPISEIVAVSATSARLLKIIKDNYHEEDGIWSNNTFRINVFESYYISSHFVL
jgi:hypothetical protein